MPERSDVPMGFAEDLGVEWLDLDPDNARARIAVEARHLQPNGVVHGGVYASLAESIASASTYGAVHDEGMVAFGQANNSTFMRPITGGHVNAAARPLQRGRSIWVWDVDLSDDDGNLCAVVRMTIAVRPQR